jgi:hypothetical protein
MQESGFQTTYLCILRNEFLATKPIKKEYFTFLLHLLCSYIHL